jgi:arylsulfatase A-like enzyme
MITSQDAQVGRVLKALDEKSLTDDTIVVYTGDHGLAIGSHGLFGKQNVYEHSQNIPLIFSGPKIPHGGTSDSIVYAFDIFPTICELLDVALPASVEGMSLAATCSDPPRRVHEGSFHVYDHLPKAAKTSDNDHPGIQRAVNDERWKLHHYRVKDKTTIRLFDLQNDPDEMHDVSQDPAAATELDTLQGLLAHKQRQFDDNQV